MELEPVRGLINLGDCDVSDIDENAKCIEAGRSIQIDRPRSVIWFLPVVTHALKGGVRTVFTFAEALSKNHGTLNVFVIYSFTGRDIETSDLEISLREFFPHLRFVLKKHINGKSHIEGLPGAQIAICTLWTTAYLLLKYNKTYRKFYLMQDFEPMFYEGGDIYVTIEQTYRFGFSCIANTPGVANRFRQYSSDVCYFYPGVDHSVFYPSRDRHRFDGTSKVVFYGRPNARNCFVVGAETLRRVKASLGDGVEIVSVGAEWDPAEYGLQGVVDNLGLLSSMNEVATIYRNCDMGLVFMATPHPSYQPLEYMASGCVVATNTNESTRWLLNSRNSIQIEPNPRVAAQRIVAALADRERMKQLRDAGLRVASEYSWDEAIRVFEERVSV
jgi:glycosyltransferase involved in cell wall biosynthesis